ncbi:hypothetical protein DPMN_077226 [Dreissena polymorpha]|uniref:Uncharacterized protein n=1 Tax=Dreissena polymorpha TaxID=45954 RepID=A0A9D3YNH2_DREPO|nr:hypothetical protein DPMN_077226 [Dreissena polymorpha]
MCWLGILGVLIVLNKSTHAEKYRISGDSTEWLQTKCNMAAPQLSYKNVYFEVNEISGNLPTSDVWIGCAVVRNAPTYTVTSIGYCKSVCVNSTLFGIQTSHGQDIFIIIIVYLKYIIVGSDWAI